MDALARAMLVTLLSMVGSFGVYKGCSVLKNHVERSTREYISYCEGDNYEQNQDECDMRTVQKALFDTPSEEFLIRNRRLGEFYSTRFESQDAINQYHVETERIVEQTLKDRREEYNELKCKLGW